MMKRFFFDSKDRNGDEVILDTSESHHIRNVLRFKSGDIIELINRQGKIYKAEIVTTSKNVLVKIISVVKPQETPSGLIIGQALIKIKKMELSLQKCTELGVDSFFPILAAHSQGNFREQFAVKRQRWCKLIDEACKQCGRMSPMRLHEVCALEDIFQRDETSQLKLLFWEKEQDTTILSLAEKIYTSSSVQLLFGPEGGFTSEEVTAAREHGYHTVSLGKRVLRSETAVIAGTSIVQHYRGSI